MTSELEEDLEINWANTRMRQLLLNDVGYTYANARLKSNYCPKCTNHRMVHDDNACNMRYEEESNATGRNNDAAPLAIKDLSSAQQALEQGGYER